MNYRIFNESKDGTLSYAFFTVQGSTPSDAIVNLLRRLPVSFWPSSVFVEDFPKFRYQNGRPLCVQKFSIVRG